MGMSGAFTALGGDPSAISENPAGLGIMRRGMFCTSLGLLYRQNNTHHYGNNNTNSTVYGNMPNLSLVLSGPGNGDYRFINLGFNFQHRIDLRNAYNLSGINPQSSKLDLYLAEVLQDPNMYLDEIPGRFPFTSGLAWGAVLLDTAGGNYYTANEQYGQTQELDATFARNVSVYEFSVGVNRLDNLYLGATIGFTSLRYQTVHTFSETQASDDKSTNLRSYVETDDLRINGSGMHMNLGVIWWVKEWLRWGAAFRGSPTLRLNEIFTRNLRAYWVDRTSTFAQSPEGVNQYRLRMPLRFQTGFALVRKDLGILSLDWEYTDFTHIRYKTDPGLAYDLSAVNTKISERFTAFWKMRLGIEKPMGMWAVRLGGFYGRGSDRLSPDFYQSGLSAGGGVNLGDFVLDVGWMYAIQANRKFLLYEAPKIPLSTSGLQTRDNNFTVSLTYRFE